MLGKAKKVLFKPITSYLDSDNEADLQQGLHTSISPQSGEQEIEGVVTLQAIRGAISQELGKIGDEVRELKDEMCKALAEMEKRLMRNYQRWSRRLKVWKQIKEN